MPMPDIAATMLRPWFIETPSQVNRKFNAKVVADEACRF
jgi:hypothetical protein